MSGERSGVDSRSAAAGKFVVLRSVAEDHSRAGSDGLSGAAFAAIVGAGFWVGKGAGEWVSEGISRELLATVFEYGGGGAKLAERCDKREVHADSVFAAGLLADLGMMALAQLETEKYLETCADCDHLVAQMNREQEVFGFTHVDVGVRLLTKWQLPEELIEAVSEHHHCPATAGKSSQILKAASVLAEVFWTADCPHMRILLPMLKTRFDLDVDDLITLATECKDAVKESVEVFQVRIDGEIDVEAIEREAQAMYDAAVLETAVDLDSLEGLMALENGLG